MNKKTMLLSSVILLVLLGGCMFGQNEQEKRKASSIKILKSNGIPFISHLPVIESENEIELRTKEEICERAICLAFVAAYAEGLEKDILNVKIEEFKVKESFTDDENAFFAMNELDDQTKAKYIWRYESLWTLLWVLSYVEDLELPQSICDVEFAVKTVALQGRDKFIENAKLRSKKKS